VAAFLDVDLEQVAQVVERRTAEAQVALLFDAGSVSPCVTISRRRFDRYSPGTSCHAGSPLCAPKLTLRPVSAGVRKMPHR